METGVYETEVLDRQADEIEDALQALALPVRVQGARKRGAWVSYQVVPVLGTRTEQVRRAAGVVAEAIRVPEVRIAPDGSGLRVEVPAPDASPLRLLPLLHALGSVPPMTALVGMAKRGAPLLIRMTDPSTWHLVVCGPQGCGKSELLRTLAVSLALTSAPSRAQVLGIDVGGRELAVLEALPHLVTGVATDRRSAGEVLHWLAEETTRRRTVSANLPELVLVLDDASWIERSGAHSAAADLAAIVDRGRGTGVHLVASFGAFAPVWLAPRGELVLAQGAQDAGGGKAGRPGRFVLRGGNDTADVRAAFLSAADLDAAVRLAQAGWRPGQALPETLGRRTPEAT